MSFYGQVVQYLSGKLSSLKVGDIAYDLSNTKEITLSGDDYITVQKPTNADNEINISHKQSTSTASEIYTYDPNKKNF